MKIRDASVQELTDTPRQAEFRLLVKELLDEGEIPGPTDLNSYMGWHGGHDINGWATRIRAEEFKLAGLFKRGDGRWVR